MKKLIMYIIIGILLVSTVMAVGVSPGIKEIRTVAGNNLHGEIKVHNNLHQNVVVSLGVRGELSKYFKLDETRLEFSANESVKSVGFEVDLSDEIKLGSYKNIIVASEISQIGNSTVTTTLEVGSIYNIEVVREKDFIKSIDVNMYIENSEKGATFIYPVWNDGEVGINEVYLHALVYDENYDVISSLLSPSIILSKNQIGDITLYDNLDNGKYKIVTNVYYDGNTKELSNEFRKTDDGIEKVNYLFNIPLIYLLLMIFVVGLFITIRNYRKLYK